MSMTMDPTTDRSVDVRETTAAPKRPVSGSSWFLPIVNAAAWIGLVSLVFTVAPDVDPDAPVDILSLLISEVFWMSAIGAFVGFLTRSRWGYGLTGIGGTALFIGAATCFAAGHTGAWIAIQALAGVGLYATGLASWRVSR